MDQQQDRVSVATLAGGGAVEMVDEALEAAWRSIQDPDTKATAKRTVTLKVELEPDKDRERVEITLSVDKRFPGHRGIETKVDLALKRGGELAVVERRPNDRQVDVEDYIAAAQQDGADITPISSGKGGGGK